MQLDEFQYLGLNLYVKVVFALQEVQEGKKEIIDKMVEHPLVHDLTGSQEIVEKVNNRSRRSLSSTRNSSRISMNTPCRADVA